MRPGEAKVPTETHTHTYTRTHTAQRGEFVGIQAQRAFLSARSTRVSVWGGGREREIEINK